MASHEFPEGDTEMAVTNGDGRSSSTATSTEEVRSRAGTPRRTMGSRVVAGTERERMIEEVRDADFPIGIRGYERAAVDDYVERVSQILAELEMSSSPESAVRHALAEVSEETREILQHAHDASDEITARSRSKADERLQIAARDAQAALDAAQDEAGETRAVALREAQELREQAQREVGELRATAAREIQEQREVGARESQQLRATAQREAEEERGTARREAEEMLERAETRARELARNAEAIWRERRRLIDEMRTVGEQLADITESESKRFPRAPDELSFGRDPAAEEAASTAGGELSP